MSEEKTVYVLIENEADHNRLLSLVDGVGCNGESWHEWEDYKIRGITNGVMNDGWENPDAYDAITIGEYEASINKIQKTEKPDEIDVVTKTRNGVEYSRTVKNGNVTLEKIGDYSVEAFERQFEETTADRDSLNKILDKMRNQRHTFEKLFGASNHLTPR